MMVKVAVLGGAGFIGSHLVDALAREGHNIIVIDNLSKGRIENIAHHLDQPGFTFHKADVLDKELLFGLVPEADAVINLVAHKIPRYSSALSTLSLNTASTANALELALKLKARFLLASTSDVYGKSPAQPLKETGDSLLGPSTSRRWAYAISKLYDEHLTIAYHQEFGLDYVILRYFGTYGPRQYLNWWGGPQGVFIKAAFNNQEIEIHGDGSQTRSFTFISDAANATLRAITRAEATGKIINIGNPEEISILDLALLIHRLCEADGEPRIKMVPYESFGGNYEDVMRRVPDISVMREVLEYEPKVDLVDGLIITIDWFKKEILGR